MPVHIPIKMRWYIIESKLTLLKVPYFVIFVCYQYPLA